jgi:hypothetical protein
MMACKRIGWFIILLLYYMMCECGDPCGNVNPLLPTFPWESVLFGITWWIMTNYEDSKLITLANIYDYLFIAVK